MTGLFTNASTAGWPSVWKRVDRHQRARSPVQLRESAFRGAILTHDLLLEDMNEPKSGPLYRGARVPASVPGETPAIQSGQIARNTNAKRGPLKKNIGTAYLDSEGQHAILMEFGWTDRSGVRHFRPFHRIIVARNKDDILDAMKEGVR